MTPAALGQVGSQLRTQYAFLDGFIADLDAGRPVDGNVSRQATMYVEAARNTYHRAERDSQRQAGMTEERNILDREARHCEGPGSCPEQSALGWQPIGSLIPIGQRICLTSDRCRMEYR